jgi:hypothetical protein
MNCFSRYATAEEILCFEAIDWIEEFRNWHEWVIMLIDSILFYYNQAKSRTSKNDSMDNDHLTCMIFTQNYSRREMLSCRYHILLMFIKK